MTLLKNLVFALLVFLALPSAAQKSKHAPEKFSISQQDLAVLLSAPMEKTISTPANPYLNKALPIKKVKNGDMQFLRFKLAYFSNAYLNVLVNGIYTTQVFVLSETG